MNKWVIGFLAIALIGFTMSGCDQTGEIPDVLQILSVSPAYNATGVSRIASLSISFNFAIEHSGITKNNLFTNYLELGAGHTAGDPELASATLSWSADSKTLAITGITGWSNVTPAAGDKQVQIKARTDKIKDTFGNVISSGTTIWQYTIQGVGGNNISGQVTYQSSGQADVTITLTGEAIASALISGTKTTTTDASGNYSISNLANGTYYITPAKIGWEISPESKVVTVSWDNSSGNDFTATPMANVSGTVYFAGSTIPMENRMVIAYATAATPNTFIATTAADATGQYQFSALEPGNYIVGAPYATGGWAGTNEAFTVTGSDVVVDLNLYPTSWEVLRVQTGENLVYIASMESAGNNPGTLYACGNGSSILIKSSAPYTTWTSVTSNPTIEPLILINDFGGMGIGLVNNQAGIFISNTQDASWAFYGDITNEVIADISFWGEGTGEVVTESGNLFRVGNLVSPPPIYSSYPNLPAGKYNGVHVGSNIGTTIEVVGDSGIAKISSDTGNSWSDIGDLSSLTSEDLRAIDYWGNYEHVGYGVVTSAQGSIFVSTDFCATWTQELTDVPCAINGAYIYGAWGNLNLGGIYVVGENGLIMRRLY